MDIRMKFDEVKRRDKYFEKENKSLKEQLNKYMALAQQALSALRSYDKGLAEYIEKKYS